MRISIAPVKSLGLVHPDEVMLDRRIDALVQLGDEVVTQLYGYLEMESQ